MYTRILVPLDGSPYSEEILPYAAGIARRGAARLVLFRVASNEQAAAGAADYLRNIAPGYRADIEPIATEDDVATAILREADRDPLALIAMTSHARTGVPETLFGSVAHRVIHAIGRPVVVFRPRGTMPGGSPATREVGTIVLALDGSAHSEAMENPAAETASWLGARMVVVQALPSQSQVPPSVPAGDVLDSGYVSLRARRIAESYRIEVDWEVLHGRAAKSLCNYVAGMEDAMLAMSSHGRGGAEKVIFGSVAAECIRRSGVPILIQVPAR